MAAYPYKKKITAALLCFFLGGFGVHRFYVGKYGTGILWLLTLGFGGIGVLIDFIAILLGGFRDKANMPLK
ncbi:MAG: TM2 domain-containing protein [Clostridiaceae bacterium]|nr:TM2 domain-containing protein [Clostridiaceae bacterium]